MLMSPTKRQPERAVLILRLLDYYFRTSPNLFFFTNIESLMAFSKYR